MHYGYVKLFFIYTYHFTNRSQMSILNCSFPKPNKNNNILKAVGFYMHNICSLYCVQTILKEVI